LASELKDLIRPPFANYDVVVYFGCGLFTLPFIIHYVPAPKFGAFLKLGLDTGVEFADAAVGTLFLLFTVYIVGHLLALFSSLFIEKTTDLLLGKMSSACILAKERKANQNSTSEIKKWVKGRWQKAWTKGTRSRSALRLFVLFPVIPSFLITYGIKWFGYFASRIPPEVFSKIERRLRNENLAAPSLEREWYKAAEHLVINNDPAAIPRMYNYLVISGLFRSLSFLFVCCAWMELIRFVGAVWEEALFTDIRSDLAILIRLGIFNFLFAFSMTSYVKFARRYAEEMLFAFALRESRTA
jgi:hypothetical protein